LIVGTNKLSTIFSGVLHPGGSDGSSGTGALTKTNSGALTLTGANLYTAGTTVSASMLVISNNIGSGTGTSAVSVNAATLGGKGIISGAVTMNSGAFLAPEHGTKTQSTLAIQSALTFNAGSTYTYTFKAKKKQAKTDKVIANGVTIASGASFNLSGTTKGTLTSGLILTVISNTSANPISGTFSNLADGAIVSVNGNNLQASYEGGDGNDLTLTVL
ncbi:MAG: autotransporter-associated beta strand repeat-containing protein, partial [Terriglobia bacterium]